MTIGRSFELIEAAILDDVFYKRLEANRRTRRSRQLDLTLEYSYHMTETMKRMSSGAPFAEDPPVAAHRL